MIIKTRFLHLHKIDIGGWFRLFGIGLSWKDLDKQRLSYSQRNGYAKYVKIGKWCITYLPKNK